MQHAVHLSLHFILSISYSGIRTSWCSGNPSKSCICIPNRHFPTWKIEVLPPITFLTALLPFPNPEHVQPPDGRPHRSIAPVASRLVGYSARRHMHSIPINTRNNYVSLNPWWIQSLVFMVWGASRTRDRYLMEKCYHFIRTRCSNPFSL
jgi:hypothetical protein